MPSPVLSAVAGADDFVVAIDEHDFGIMAAAFVFCVLSVAANNHEIADVNKSGGGAVEANDSRTRFPTDGVSCQAISIIDVVNIHLLPFDNVRGFHQERINRDAAFVVQTGIRHCGSMNLGLQQITFHECNKQNN